MKVAQLALDANAALDRAWSERFPAIDLPDDVRLVLLGHVWFESMFGRDGSMRGTNQWGAIHATNEWIKSHQREGFGVFTHRDAHTEGPSPVYYYPEFRAYRNQLLAARDYLAFLTGYGLNLLEVARTPEEFSRALKARGYYEGYPSGAPLAAKIASYATSVRAGMQTVQAALDRGVAHALFAADPELAGRNEPTAPGRAVTWFGAPPPNEEPPTRPEIWTLGAKLAAGLAVAIGLGWAVRGAAKVLQ